MMGLSRTTNQILASLLVVSLSVPVLLGASAAFTHPEADGPATSVEVADSGSTYSFGDSDLASGLSHVTTVANGKDIRGSRVVGDTLYAVGHSGFYVFNISDPTDPQEVSYTFCPGRDIAVSGDWAVIIPEGGRCINRSSGIQVFDISDPTEPVLVAGWTVQSHTVANYGDEGLFHVATQALTPHLAGSIVSPGYQEIIDARDGSPSRTRWHFPNIARNFDVVEAPSCHEIWFDEALERGYCAGVTETHIWDMENPLLPKIISVIRNPSVSIHHSVRTAQDGTILILNDEEGGALVPACYNTEVVERSPRGALWFYDISNEERPLLQSWVAVPDNILPLGFESRCTAHYGTVLENDVQAVWGWYGAGTVLLDFSNILLPTITDAFHFGNADTWGANLHESGYVISGDMNRGIDVYGFTQ